MNKNNLMVPIAIVIAGIIVAGAMVFNNFKTSNSSPTPANPNIGIVGSNEITMAPLATDEHRLGAANAKVTIVEYSDLECPFCKQYQSTLNQILSTYGTSSGKVAWVYRQFPLAFGQAALHPRAEKEAEASECANEIGGNDKFWQFIDKIFSITPSNNQLDPAILTQVATQIGLDTKTFQTCLDSGKYKDKITASFEEGVKAGARGTPYTVLVTKDGRKYPLTDQAGTPVGAVSFDDLKAVIDNTLKIVK